MIYSRRLSRIPAHVLFILFTLAGLALSEPVVKENMPLYLALHGLAAFFALNGTIGWQIALRRKMPEPVYAYFTVQSALLVLLLLVERSAASYVSVGVVCFVPLTIQICVLPPRWRRAVFLVLLVAMIVLYSSKTTPAQVLPQAVAIAIPFGLILLLGNLIVGEERALTSNRKLVQYAAEAEELATLRERNRLAREIHDNVGHYLTAVNMQIEAAMALLPADPARTMQVLTKAQTLTKEGLSEIRRSIQALRASPMENRALHEAIRLLAEEHQAAGSAIAYQIEGDVKKCSPVVDMTLYRIAQEGLTNIRKHARADRTDLILRYHPSVVQLQVSDNGIGRAQAEDGFGLTGIRERVQLLGGTLRIQTEPGRGFRLEVEFPYEHDSRAAGG